MAKNQVQFQKGLSLPQFLKQYGTQSQCHDALFNWCWPSGFICPECGHVGYCEITGRRYVSMPSLPPTDFGDRRPNCISQSRIMTD